MRSKLTPAKWLLLLALLGLPVLAARADDEKKTDDLPSFDDLIEKIITAEGGREAMAKITTRITRGTAEIPAQGMRGAIESWQGGTGKFRSRMTFEGLGAFEHGVLEDVVWSEDVMMGGRILDGIERELAMRETHVHPVLHFKEDFKTIKVIGKKTVGGTECYQVEGTPAVGPAETYYFGVEDHRTRRHEMVLETPELGKVKTITDTFDYKDVDGILLPHRFVVDQGMMKINLTIDAYVHNEEIPAERFALPPIVKKIIEKKAKEPAEKQSGEKEKAKEKPVSGTGGE